VPAGIVGLLCGPADPNDAKPGSGDNASGVRIAFPASAGVSVELGSPGLLQPGIVGEAGDRLPDAGVRCPAEVDPAGLARSACDRRRTALVGGLFSAVDPIQDRADLGQQLSRD
jgi:hypothetical protein